MCGTITCPPIRRTDCIVILLRADTGVRPYIFIIPTKNRRPNRRLDPRRFIRYTASSLPIVEPKS